MIAARRHGPPQPPEVRQQVGAAMRAAREAAGISQSAVARRIGITPAMVCYVERGHKRAPLDRLDDLAEVYGLQRGDFERPPAVTRDADEVALLAGFRHLSEDERAALLALVHS